MNDKLTTDQIIELINRCRGNIHRIEITIHYKEPVEIDVIGWGSTTYKTQIDNYIED